MTSLQDIADTLQGYDPSALSIPTARAFLARLAPTPVTEASVPLMDALDRVLAKDVISPLSVPPHNNSAMDGYALRGADLCPGQGGSARVVGTALAGAAWKGAVAAGECLKIMTGSILPEALDTVIPLELVSVQDDRVSWPAHAVQPGDNRRLLGEDLMAGQAALARGQRVTPAALGLLASLGLPHVSVYPRLKVAYFSTGDEILSLGQAAREGAVFDSNRYTVFGLLRRLGIEVLDMGVVPDQAQALEQAFADAAKNADAIITSGGVSMGEADHTKAVMRRVGDVAFWRIAMRPGRPMAVGLIERAGRSPCVLFGLPGNPVAVMVTFLALVRPTLLRMMGSDVAEPIYLRAQCAEPIRKKPGRTEYQRGWVNRGPDGENWVRTTGNQGSGVLSSMVRGNGLIVLHHEQGGVEVGQTVDVMMFDGAI